MFKVTNKTNDPRKFYVGKLGRDVIVEAKKSVETEYPPLSNDVWKVEDMDKKVKKLKEEDYNDSSGSK